MSPGCEAVIPSGAKAPSLIAGIYVRAEARTLQKMVDSSAGAYQAAVKVETV